MGIELRVFFLIVAMSASTKAAEWKLCADGSAHVTSVTVTPDPVSSGMPATFGVDTEFSHRVTYGTFTATVRYLGIEVYRRTVELCTAMQHCPLEAGVQQLQVAEKMPRFLPPGSMKLTLAAEEAHNIPLFCVVIDLRASLSQPMSTEVHLTGS